MPDAGRPRRVNHLSTAKEGLVPGEEAAQGEVSLARHQMGGGLPDHAVGEQGGHLHGEAGT